MVVLEFFFLFNDFQNVFVYVKQLLGETLHPLFHSPHGHKGQGCVHPSLLPDWQGCKHFAHLLVLLLGH